jgi:hypothetical protein
MNDIKAVQQLQKYNHLLKLTFLIKVTVGEHVQLYEPEDYSGPG